MKTKAKSTIENMSVADFIKDFDIVTDAEEIDGRYQITGARQNSAYALHMWSPTCARVQIMDELVGWSDYTHFCVCTTSAGSFNFMARKRA